MEERHVHAASGIYFYAEATRSDHNLKKHESPIMTCRSSSTFPSMLSHLPCIWKEESPHALRKCGMLVIHSGSNLIRKVGMKADLIVNAFSEAEAWRYYCRCLFRTCSFGVTKTKTTRCPQVL